MYIILKLSPKYPLLPNLSFVGHLLIFDWVSFLFLSSHRFLYFILSLLANESLHWNRLRANPSIADVDACIPVNPLIEDGPLSTTKGAPRASPMMSSPCSLANVI